jgi:hypothetical protein
VAAGMSGAHQSLVISALLLAGGWRCDGVVTNAENLQHPRNSGGLRTFRIASKAIIHHGQNETTVINLIVPAHAVVGPYQGVWGLQCTKC